MSVRVNIEAPTYGSTLRSTTDGDVHTPKPDESRVKLMATSARPTAFMDEHLGQTRQYMRDMILGVNDGLISTFLLVAGVAGGNMPARQILLTAIAGALAGAISMFSGEYVATKSQNEVMVGEIALEKEHIELYLEEELQELEGHLTAIGIHPSQVAIRRQLEDYYRSNPTCLLKAMSTLEFGVVDQEIRSPIRAGLMSCCLFLAGALPSVVPFACTDDAIFGLYISAVTATCALLAVGAVKTWATRGKCLSAAFENLVIAGVGGSFAYAVGVGFDRLLSTSTA